MPTYVEFPAEWFTFNKNVIYGANTTYNAVMGNRAIRARMGECVHNTTRRSDGKRECLRCAEVFG